MSSRDLRAIAIMANREQALLVRLSGYSGPMADLPDKVAAIRATAELFDRHGIPYALIGGVAVGLRSGVPRATLDVDFAVVSSVDLDQLVAHMAASGFLVKGRFPHSINFEHPGGEPVQI